jgi:hypothetical protein
VGCNWQQEVDHQRHVSNHFCKCFLFRYDNGNHGNQNDDTAPLNSDILCMYADIFITAVMTGPPGQNGMSVLLVHKDTPGFSVRKVNIRGADLSGVATLLLRYGAGSHGALTLNLQALRIWIFRMPACPWII